MRVHREIIRDGPSPAMFKEQGGSMSTDWDKYSSPEVTRGRAKSPIDNGILVLEVGGIRGVEDLEVDHVPLLQNQAHSQVTGIEKGDDPRARKVRKDRIRVKLFQLFRDLLINPGDPL